MFKAGHVKLLAAMCAAIGLHALLFTLFPSQNRLILHTPEGELHVELLAKKTASPAPAIAREKNASTTPHTDEVAIKAQPKPQIQKPSKITAQQHVPTVIQIATKTYKKTDTVQKQVAETEPATTERSEASTVAEQLQKQSSPVTTMVPQDIQKTILAQVHYPKRARRHGWQGRAEFQFNVYQQNIHEIIMLASSGHPILDRAARKGLTSVNQIPLSNGLYRIPVVFRLQ